MRDLTEVTKALADEGRLRIVAALEGGELCVCQVVAFLDLAGSTVSRHLAVLRQAGLVTARKDGRWIHYRLAEDSASAAVRNALAFVRASVDADARRADARALARIRAQDLETICARQAARKEKAR